MDLTTCKLCGEPAADARPTQSLTGSEAVVHSEHIDAIVENLLLNQELPQHTWSDNTSPYGDAAEAYKHDATLCLVEHAGRRIEQYKNDCIWARAANVVQYLALWAFGLGASFKGLEVYLKRRHMHLTREGRISLVAVIALTLFVVGWRKLRGESAQETAKLLKRVAPEELAEKLAEQKEPSAQEQNMPFLPEGLRVASRYKELDLPDAATSKTCCHEGGEDQGRRLTSGHHVSKQSLDHWVDAIYQGTSLDGLPRQWTCENAWHTKTSPRAELFELAGRRYREASERYTRGHLHTWAKRTIVLGGAASCLSEVLFGKYLGFQRVHAVALGVLAGLATSYLLATRSDTQTDPHAVKTSFGEQQPGDNAVEALIALPFKKVAEKAAEAKTLRNDLSEDVCLGFAVWAVLQAREINEADGEERRGDVDLTQLMQGLLD